MKKAKRVLALLLCLVLILSAVGCSAKKDDGKKSSDSEVVTVVDNNGNTVTVKKDIQRIVVCDIYPIPSVLAVFFDSASKIVGMAQPSMAAAKNSLLSELYPEILNAETGIPDVKFGDRATLVGHDGDAYLSIDELAGLSGRFNYEFICDINKRVPREYLRDGKVVEQVDYF